jgi:UDP-GlcNAc:undecaprenyl-phosphate/decaprenyl-phosphate GlcNAc-1-phosphate transferase
MTMTLYLLPIMTGLLACVALTPIARLIAVNVGLIDKPEARKVHLRATPLLGGLAIYLAAVVATIIATPSSAYSQIFSVLAGATLLLVVGILDDRGLLHHQLKLMVAMPLAAMILLVSGIRATVFSAGWLPGPAELWIAVDYVISLIWIVGLTASFSILDHMDGLCSGVAGVAALFFLIIAASNGQVLVATLAAAVFGATMGFLVWNFNPAKIFMGDGGAMFLGFMMATLSLSLGVPDTAGAPPFLVPMIILGGALFDTLLVIISRTRRGLVPFASPGKDHTAHRLSNLGLGTRGAVLAMYAIGACFGLLALLAQRLTMMQSLTLVAILVIVVGAAVVALERAPYQHQGRTAH